MTDYTLRTLERGAAIGDVEAGARLLSHRVRAGELDHSLVAYIAKLGDPAARQYMQNVDDNAASEVEPSSLDFLAELGARPLVRAEIACARSLQFAVEGELSKLYEVILSAAEALEYSREHEGDDSVPMSPVRLALLHAATPIYRQACDLWRSGDLDILQFHLMGVVFWMSKDSLMHSTNDLSMEFTMDCYKRLGQNPLEAVLGSTRRELVPWVLGYGDPLRERVEAR